MNTFHVIVISDSQQRTFALYFFEDIQWFGQALIGFQNGNNSILLPESRNLTSEETVISSNVGVSGLYVYRVDQTNIISPTMSYKTNLFKGAPPGCLCGARPTVILKVPSVVSESNQTLRVCARLFTIADMNITMNISTEDISATGKLILLWLSSHGDIDNIDERCLVVLFLFDFFLLRSTSL